MFRRPTQHDEAEFAELRDRLSNDATDFVEGLTPKALPEFAALHSSLTANFFMRDDHCEKVVSVAIGLLVVTPLIDAASNIGHENARKETHQLTSVDEMLDIIRFAFDGPMFLESRRIAESALRVVMESTEDFMDSVIHEDTLDAIFQFLQKPLWQSDYYAKNFSKLIQEILERKTDEVLAYLSKNPAVMRSIISCRGSYDVLAICLKIALAGSEDQGAQVLFDTAVHESFFQQLHESFDEEECHNVSTVICDFIALCRDYESTFILWDEMFALNFMKKYLLPILKWTGRRLVCGLAIIVDAMNLLRLRNKSERSMVGENGFNQAILSGVGMIVKILEPGNDSICGFARVSALHIAWYCLEILKPQEETVYQDHGLLKAAWDAFLRFERANIYHGIFSDGFEDFLNSAPKPVLESISTHPITEDILLLKQDAESKSKPKPLFFGHIDRLGSTVYKCLSSNNVDCLSVQRLARIFSVETLSASRIETSKKSVIMLSRSSDFELDDPKSHEFYLSASLGEMGPYEKAPWEFPEPKLPNIIFEDFDDELMSTGSLRSYFESINEQSLQSQEVKPENKETSNEANKQEATSAGKTAQPTLRRVESGYLNGKIKEPMSETIFDDEIDCVELVSEEEQEEDENAPNGGSKQQRASQEIEERPRNSFLRRISSKSKSSPRSRNHSDSQPSQNLNAQENAFVVRDEWTTPRKSCCNVM